MAEPQDPPGRREVVPDVPVDERTDRDLLAAHVAGDPDAFTVLVRRHRDRLWAVALRTTGHREDAADGLQDGLLSAYRRAGSFRGEAAVTTWLHRVVVNACLDRLRASKVRRADPLPEDLEEYEQARRGVLGDPTRPARDPADDDPARHSVAAERRRDVLAALATLPAAQRAALVLVDLEGFPVAEAAEILGCRPGTVKSRCSRGRAVLAGLLRAWIEDPDDDPASGARNRAATRTVPPVPPARGPPDAR